MNLPAGPQAAAATRSHTLPPTDLLEPPEPFPFEELAEKAQAAAETLEQTFSDFGLNVTVSEIDTGPVVTQFELDLEKGLRVNKVAALADDLAVALRVPAVRIVNPIPGKNTVGVEVPNDTRVMVRLREIAETAVGAEEMAIPIFLGKDVSGAPLVVDLAKMPHLLIAGRTGTGKSVCLNTLILSMLLSRTPEEVKMLMIDPKMVELSPYKTLPHLMHPVITDMKKAEAVLAWAVDKMEERYDLLARCGVRHLTDFNALSRKQKLDKLGLSELHEEADALTQNMPYIVIVARRDGGPDDDQRQGGGVAHHPPRPEEPGGGHPPRARHAEADGGRHHRAHQVEPAGPGSASRSPASPTAASCWTSPAPSACWATATCSTSPPARAAWCGARGRSWAGRRSTA